MKRQSDTLFRSGKLASALVALILQAGCVYSHVRTPMDRNFDRTELGTRSGHSSVHSVLWLFAWGDGGTKAAAEDGQVSVIRHADTEFRLFLLGAYTRVTTIVYGD